MGLLDAIDDATQARASTSYCRAEARPAAGPWRCQSGSAAHAASAGVDDRDSDVVDHLPTTGRVPLRSGSTSNEQAASKPRLARPVPEWSLSQLQSEAQRYGFRKSKDRAVLISQVEAVHKALAERRREQESRAARQPFDADLLISDESSLSVVALSDDEEDRVGEMDEVGDLTAALLAEEHGQEIAATIPTTQQAGAQGRTVALAERQSAHLHSPAPSRSGSGSEDGDCGGNEEDSGDDSHDDEEESPHVATAQPNMGRVPPAVAQQLHAAIVADEDLYARILLFEPVSFDEVSSTAKRAGVTGLRSKETLRNWLDVQCICFYSAELTGQRQRY